SACTYGPRPPSSLAACAAEEKRREEKRREEKRREEKRREEKRREEKRREEKFFVGRMHINSEYLRLNY
ncbi:TPA: hypothetical protein WMX24_001970, partial [Neisseria gonorrhoeae]